MVAPACGVGRVELRAAPELGVVLVRIACLVLAFLWTEAPETSR